MPKDNFRYGHKLWTDAATGLLLKARMVDEADHVVEQFAFTQLVIKTGITRDSVKPSFTVTPDWTWDVAGADPGDKVDTGWTVLSQPVGFKKVMEMKRFKNGAQSPIAHLVYSDGLVAVSVFIEPLPTKRKYQEGLTHQGAVNIFTRPLPDQLVTVLGEAPAITVMQMANSVAPKGQ
jgi:sigma-E factor negative regulatory protein RseB